MPRAKWMTDTDYKKFEDCLEDLKGKQGIDRYAVCMNSVKKGHEQRKRVLKRLK